MLVFDCEMNNNAYRIACQLICYICSGFLTVYVCNMESNDQKETWLSEEIWYSMDGKTTEFVFSQGEKYLSELCKVSDSITNRCYTLLGIIMAVSPFLVTTVISIQNFLFSSVAYLFASVCVGVCIVLIGVIKPRGGYSVGRDPKSLLRIEDLDHYKQTKRISYLKYELESLQNKIEETNKANESRSEQYRIVLYVLLISFCCLLVFSMLFTSLKN